MISRKPNLRETFSIAGAVLTFIAVVSLLPHVLAGGTGEYTLVTIYQGVSVKFYLDGLGILFAGTASLLWIVAGFYCIGYMRGLNEHAQTRFYVCYAVSVVAGDCAATSGSRLPRNDTTPSRARPSRTSRRRIGRLSPAPSPGAFPS